VGQGLGGVLEQLLGPPGGFILLALLGLVLGFRQRRLGLGLSFTALGLLYIASLPITALALLSGLEPAKSLSVSDLASGDGAPQAIVILGAGHRYSPEFGGETVNAAALQRLRYGAWLAKATGLPVLLTGGLAHDDRPAEAVLMQQVLEQELGVPVRWLETRSRNTYENAKFSTALLKADGIERIYLVTHALHMQRSLMSFKRFGLQVTPAPTAYEGRGWQVTGRAFLPKAEAMSLNGQIFHEWVGMLWYGLRY
jgi:uncharacterized SAM-binding protein YcdF (DUF218 family)